MRTQGNLSKVLAVCLVLISGFAVYEAKTPKEDKLVALADKSLPKSVMIYVAAEVNDGEHRYKGVVRGAGVFVSANNHILTCAHLFFVDKVTGITVCTSDDQCTSADLLYKEDNHDLALLQAYYDKPTSYIKITDPRNLKVGQEVIAIGNPMGLPFTVSHGIISFLYRDLGAYYNLTQSDVMINPGNSGGPLINLKGELVGINNLIRPVVPFFPVNSGLSFSVQSGQIIEFLTRFRGLDKSIPKLGYEYWMRYKREPKESQSN